MLNELNKGKAEENEKYLDDRKKKNDIRKNTFYKVKFISILYNSHELNCQS